jgi:hypothetical protein
VIGDTDLCENRVRPSAGALPLAQVALPSTIPIQSQGSSSVSSARTAGAYSGTLLLQPRIGKDGTVENLQLISGQRALVPAAIEAVKE